MIRAKRKESGRQTTIIEFINKEFKKKTYCCDKKGLGYDELCRLLNNMKVSRESLFDIIVIYLMDIGFDEDLAISFLKSPACDVVSLDVISYFLHLIHLGTFDNWTALHPKSEMYYDATYYLKTDIDVNNFDKQKVISEIQQYNERV